MDPVALVGEIIQRVKRLSPQDLAIARRAAEKQTTMHSQAKKPSRAMLRIRETGEHNLRIIDALEALKAVVTEATAPPPEPAPAPRPRVGPRLARRRAAAAAHTHGDGGDDPPPADLDRDGD